MSELRARRFDTSEDRGFGYCLEPDKSVVLEVFFSVTEKAPLLYVRNVSEDGPVNEDWACLGWFTKNSVRQSWEYAVTNSTESILQ